MRVIGGGGGREAVEARMPGRSDTVVRKAARACEGCEGKHVLRTVETYREAALLFDLMAQYGPDSVRLHGLCENRTDGITSIVMEKLNISGVGLLASWRAEVGEDEVKLQISRYAVRLGSFNAGALNMVDSKWHNVGVNERGQIHALDAGDFQISGTRSHQHRFQLLQHEIYVAHPSQKPPRSLSRLCPERQPIHLPLETCAGLRDIRLLGRGPRGLLWEAQMPGVKGTVIRKTARITDLSWGLHRFALYREATMLADLQAHYGANETARFHGVCDATDVSIVMDKLDDVQARWLSCLLEKAWTPHGWASLGELRRHECRTHSNLYEYHDEDADAGCEALFINASGKVQWCRRFDNDPTGCNGNIVTYANGSNGMCDHHPATDGQRVGLPAAKSGCFPRYPAFACGARGATAGPRAAEQGGTFGFWAQNPHPRPEVERADLLQLGDAAIYATTRRTSSMRLLHVWPRAARYVSVQKVYELAREYQATVRFHKQVWLTKTALERYVRHCYGNYEWMHNKSRNVEAAGRQMLTVYWVVDRGGHDMKLALRRELTKTAGRDGHHKDVAHCTDDSNQTLLLSRLLLFDESLRWLNRSLDASRCQKVGAKLAVHFGSPEVVPGVWLHPEDAAAASDAVLGFRASSRIDMLYDGRASPRYAQIVTSSLGELRTHAASVSTVAGHDSVIDTGNLLWNQSHLGFCFGVKFVLLE